MLKPLTLVTRRPGPFQGPDLSAFGLGIMARHTPVSADPRFGSELTLRREAAAEAAGQNLSVNLQLLMNSYSDTRNTFLTGRQAILRQLGRQMGAISPELRREAERQVAHVLADAGTQAQTLLTAAARADSSAAQPQTLTAERGKKKQSPPQSPRVDKVAPEPRIIERIVRSMLVPGQSVAPLAENWQLDRDLTPRRMGLIVRHEVSDILGTPPIPMSVLMLAEGQRTEKADFLAQNSPPPALIYTTHSETRTEAVTAAPPAPVQLTSATPDPLVIPRLHSEAARSDGTAILGLARRAASRNTSTLRTTFTPPPVARPAVPVLNRTVQQSIHLLARQSGYSLILQRSTLNHLAEGEIAILRQTAMLHETVLRENTLTQAAPLGRGETGSAPIETTIPGQSPQFREQRIPAPLPGRPETPLILGSQGLAPQSETSGTTVPATQPAAAPEAPSAPQTVPALRALPALAEAAVVRAALTRAAALTAHQPIGQRAFPLSFASDGRDFPAPGRSETSFIHSILVQRLALTAQPEGIQAPLPAGNAYAAVVRPAQTRQPAQAPPLRRTEAPAPAPAPRAEAGQPAFENGRPPLIMARALARQLTHLARRGLPIGPRALRQEGVRSAPIPLADAARAVAGQATASPERPRGTPVSQAPAPMGRDVYTLLRTALPAALAPLSRALRSTRAPALGPEGTAPAGRVALRAMSTAPAYGAGLPALGAAALAIHRKAAAGLNPGEARAILRRAPRGATTEGQSFAQAPDPRAADGPLAAPAMESLRAPAQPGMPPLGAPSDLTPASLPRLSLTALHPATLRGAALSTAAAAPMVSTAEAGMADEIPGGGLTHFDARGAILARMPAPAVANSPGVGPGFLEDEAILEAQTLRMQGFTPSIRRAEPEAPPAKPAITQQTIDSIVEEVLAGDNMRRLTDRVYTALERRIRQEKRRFGL